jgi:AcrR family transcriptional regulator
MRPRILSDDQILEGARGCFLQHGPAISTAHIAAELGLSQATLFKRFGTKDELMLKALLPRGDEPLFALLDAGPDDRPVGEQLCALASTCLDMLFRVIPCMMTLRAASESAAHSAMRDPSSGPLRVQSALLGWIVRAQARGMLRPVAPRILMSALLGALRNRTFTTHLSGATRDEAEELLFVRDLVQLLLDGAGPLPAPRPAPPPSAPEASALETE